jgi:hypothetical protein
MCGGVAAGVWGADAQVRSAGERRVGWADATQGVGMGAVVLLCVRAGRLRCVHVCGVLMVADEALHFAEHGRGVWGHVLFVGRCVGACVVLVEGVTASGRWGWHGCIWLELHTIRSRQRCWLLL